MTFSATPHDRARPSGWPVGFGIPTWPWAPDPATTKPRGVSRNQEARQEIDAWEDILANAVENIEVSKTGHRVVQVSLLWDLLGIPAERRDRRGAMRIAENMQRLGFVRSTTKDDESKKVRSYPSPRGHLAPRRGTPAERPEGSIPVGMRPFAGFAG